MIDTQTDRQTDTHTHTQTQATTIPEGQNWPRVKTIILQKQNHTVNTESIQGRVMLSDDFDRGDNLDFDYLLRQYIDDESGLSLRQKLVTRTPRTNLPTICSPKAASSKAHRAKRRKCNRLQPIDAVYYICPVCQKELKTIGDLGDTLARSTISLT